METKLLEPAFHISKSLNLAANSVSVRSSFSTGKSRFGVATSLSLRQSAASPIRYSRGLRVDESESLTLDSIRHSLIRQEDSIIFNLLERAQYCYNADTYDEDAFAMEGFQGSLVEFVVRETEKLHAKVGRYKSPDEHPFFPQCLPEPILPPIRYPQVLHRCADSININKKVWNMYSNTFFPDWLSQGMTVIVVQLLSVTQCVCRYFQREFTLVNSLRRPSLVKNQLSMKQLSENKTGRS